jgi:hypothetical protein
VNQDVAKKMRIDSLYKQIVIRISEICAFIKKPPDVSTFFRKRKTHSFTLRKKLPEIEKTSQSALCVNRVIFFLITGCQFFRVIERVFSGTVPVIASGENQ